MAQPPAKKARAEEEDVEMKAEETPELEKDAAELKGAAVASAVTFHTPDTTLNLLPSVHGSMLTSLSEGGFQHLCAGARASVGIKSGRYAFEAKLLEFVSPYEHRSHNTSQKQSIRVGFSLAGSSLFLGETQDSVCFSASEGFFVHNKQRTWVGQNVSRDTVLCVVLNLEKGHPNFGTVSLFKDGVRVSKPQPLPDHLKGKPLYPTVSFRNMVVHMNFGPQPLTSLPFKCHMVGSARQKDATETKAPDDKGKHQVVYPVGLPESGVFDWADQFLKEHPDFVELSDRVILDWAENSGVQRQRGYSLASRKCLDQPDMDFGIASMDDLSVRRLLQSVAPIQKRNYLVLELKGNLTASDRKDSLARFPSKSFNKVAMVFIGDPPAEFKKRQQELALQAKQAQSDKEFSDRKLAEKRKRELEKKRKEVERLKKKAEKERAKKLADEKKKKQDEEEDAKGEKTGEEGKEEVKEDKDEAKEETKAEDDEEEEEEETKDEPEDNEHPPKLELDAEEKKMVFRKMPVPDLKDSVMNTAFTSFTLPDKAEGFDDIKMEWTKVPSKCSELMKKWILEKKLVTRIDDITPSQPFFDSCQKWAKVLAQWKAKEKEYREKQSARAAAKAARAAVKRAAEMQKGDGAETQDGKPMEVEEEEPDEEDKAEANVNFAEMDVFGVEDVMDVGAGIPLFKEFDGEDWVLTALRVELHLLIKSFKEDSKDPDRSAIHVDHVPFYYNRYFKKALVPKNYGVEDVPALLELVKDIIFVDTSKLVESLLPEDYESFAMFVKLAEEDRRHRNLQVDKPPLKFNMVGLGGSSGGGGGSWNQDTWNKGGAYRGGGGSSAWQNTKGSGSGKAWGWSHGGGGGGSGLWADNRGHKGGVGKSSGYGQKGYGKDSFGGGGKGQMPLLSAARPQGMSSMFGRA